MSIGAGLTAITSPMYLSMGLMPIPEWNRLLYVSTYSPSLLFSSWSVNSPSGGRVGRNCILRVRQKRSIFAFPCGRYAVEYVSCTSRSASPSWSRLSLIALPLSVNILTGSPLLLNAFHMQSRRLSPLSER